MLRKTTVTIVALLIPLFSHAEDAVDPASVADAILNACIPAAVLGKPIDTTPLLAYFKADRKGQKLNTKGPLPPMQLVIYDEGTWRCVLGAKKTVGDSVLAQRVVEKIKAWPAIKHTPIKSLDEVYSLDGDATLQSHGIAITIERQTTLGTWEVMLWDNGVPKQEPAAK